MVPRLAHFYPLVIEPQHSKLGRAKHHVILSSTERKQGPTSYKRQRCLESRFALARAHGAVLLCEPNPLHLIDVAVHRAQPVIRGAVLLTTNKVFYPYAYKIMLAYAAAVVLHQWPF